MKMMATFPSGQRFAEGNTLALLVQDITTNMAPVTLQSGDHLRAYWTSSVCEPHERTWDVLWDGVESKGDFVARFYEEVSDAMDECPLT